jgi:phage shock protein E
MIQVNFKISYIFAIVVVLYVGASWASDEGTMIIDVRSDREWQAGHLATAVHLPLNNIAQDIDGLVDNKHQKIYLYCRSGNRSGKAEKILQSLGYSHVINAGGIAEASDFLDQPIVAD